MSMSKALTSHGYVGFYAAYARIAGGDPIVGLMLSQAAFLSSRSDDGWFEMSVREIEEWTCLSVKQQRRAVEILVSMGLMETKEEGMCMVRHAKVDFERLDSLVEELGVRKPSGSRLRQKGASGEAERAQPVSPKGRHSLYKEVNRSEGEVERASAPASNPPERLPVQGKGIEDESSPKNEAAPPPSSAAPPRRRKAFVPPTKEQWLAHAANHWPWWPRRDAESSYDYYSAASNPWTMSNGDAVKDWGKCAGNCARRYADRNPQAKRDWERQEATRKRQGEELFADRPTGPQRSLFDIVREHQHGK